MTSTQIQLVQIARRQLDLDEADYRQVLRDVGGVASCKQLTNEAMEDVMAHFEHMGFRMTGGKPADYWRQKTFNRGIFVDARQVHLIRELSAQIPRYTLPGMCLRFTHGRTDDVTKLSMKEAFNLHEMLKKAIARERASEVCG
ncbi:MAG: phage protein GemA/Gp16 family protein [Tepidisphaeraceae bacterium]